MPRVLMLLANGPDSPDGDTADRIALRVCLTAQGQIDEAAFHEDPLPWATQRTTPDGRVFMGELIRADGGWALRRSGSEDDPVWPFEPEIMRPGEYVTLRPPTGGELIYRIVGIDDE